MTGKKVYYKESSNLSVRFINAVFFVGFLYSVKSWKWDQLIYRLINEQSNKVIE